MNVQFAHKNHARDLAYLLNLAGEGIPEYLWEKMITGSESALDVGEKRAQREDGGFSYTNAKVCLEKDILQGMIVSYKQPNPYEAEDLSEYPEMVRPLIELESKSPGSWYINAIATFEEHRSKGVAQKLIEDSIAQAKMQGCDCMSLIAASENSKAKGLYDFLGFEIKASLPVVLYPGCLHGGDWILMEKDLRSA